MPLFHTCGPNEAMVVSGRISSIIINDILQLSVLSHKLTGNPEVSRIGNMSRPTIGLGPLKRVNNYVPYFVAHYQLPILSSICETPVG